MSLFDRGGHFRGKTKEPLRQQMLKTLTVIVNVTGGVLALNNYWTVCE